jgi:hypothetical protein
MRHGNGGAFVTVEANQQMAWTRPQPLQVSHETRSSSLKCLRLHVGTNQPQGVQHVVAIHHVVVATVP